MNLEEIQSLNNFLNQLVQAHGVGKDPQAESMIAGAVAQQPDAAYLLVQRALLVEQALNKANVQIASLQSQLEAAKSPSARGFLDAETWGNTPAAAPRPAAGMPAAYVPPAPMQSQTPAATPGIFRDGLGTVAATAAGVAGGAFLFEGIEHMMHHGGAPGFMNPPGMASLASPTGSTTGNNFYDSDPPMTSTSPLDFLATDDVNLDDDSMLG